MRHYNHDLYRVEVKRHCPRRLAELNFCCYCINTVDSTPSLRPAYKASRKPMWPFTRSYDHPISKCRISGGRMQPAVRARQIKNDQRAIFGQQKFSEHKKISKAACQVFGLKAPKSNALLPDRGRNNHVFK